jgi:hypothetical protein
MIAPCFITDTTQIKVAQDQVTLMHMKVPHSKWILEQVQELAAAKLHTLQTEVRLLKEKKTTWEQWPQ